MDCSSAGSSLHGTLRASGLPFPPPGDLPDPGIEPGSPALQADSLLTELQGKPLLDSLANSPLNDLNDQPQKTYVQVLPSGTCESEYLDLCKCN